MGMYLLAAIVFLLFIVFIADLIRDSRGNKHDFDHNLYTTEFGNDEFIVGLDDESDFNANDNDERFSKSREKDVEFGEDLGFDEDDEDLSDQTDDYYDRHNIQEDDDFQMNFKRYDTEHASEFDVSHDSKESTFEEYANQEVHEPDGDIEFSKNEVEDFNESVRMKFYQEEKLKNEEGIERRKEV